MKCQIPNAFTEAVDKNKNLWIACGELRPARHRLRFGPSTPNTCSLYGEAASVRTIGPDPGQGVGQEARSR